MTGTVTIKGIIESIKSEKQFDTTHLVEFIVNHNTEKRKHYYILRAFSPGNTDAYKISNLIGFEVEADCYLNGRKSEGTQGNFYSNDLTVKNLRSV